MSDHLVDAMLDAHDRHYEELMTEAPWREINPERFQAPEQKPRKVKKSKPRFRHNPERNEWLTWLARQIALSTRPHRCEVCEVWLGKSSLEAHHVVPLADGGSIWPNNIQLLCGRCHRQAHKRLARRE